jgi:ribosome maturation factor RimP
VLEVSTPGVDRPLTRLKDFEAFEGYEARLELDRVAEGRRRFRGQLAGVEDENVGINLDEEPDATVYVPFAWITDAKLVLTDELMKRGAALRAARGEPEDDGLPEGAPDADRSTDSAQDSTHDSTKDDA